ncbi:MAG TPA: Na+/H+ antiporter NhaA [Vicinamibacterales bacterium]|nr:Na+/H+ antiporter NhaA [Vicinamibacterales bacterium]
MRGGGRGFVAFVLDNSLLLVAGTLIGVVWANVDDASYDRFAHAAHFVVNDIGMVFFFALAAKEVFEATLPGGALASPRQAAVPLVAAAGGMAVPAAIYSAFVFTLGPATLGRGWAIPCATDIAFSYLTARIIFPPGHAAIPFLLLLAIADDALGLIILALFYPTGEVSLTKLGLGMLVAVTFALWLRRRRARSVWPYVLGAGSASWLALYAGGFHPALALVPVVPFMPHAARDIGLFDPAEHGRPDTLDRFEHWSKGPVEVVLFFFGLVNAGVPFANVGPGTWYVLAGLLAGKPIGIVGFSLAAVGLGLGRLRGVSWRDLVVVGMAAGIGFTVALFFATAAFPGGAALDETKMGALFSFAAAPLAWIAARALGVGRAQRAGRRAAIR